MYSVQFSKYADKQLDKLPTEIQQRIVKALDRIKIRPFHFVKRKEGTPYYILRVGYYRVILDIRANELIIIVIELGHRKKIYK